MDFGILMPGDTRAWILRSGSRILRAHGVFSFLPQAEHAQAPRIDGHTGRSHAKQGGDEQGRGATGIPRHRG